MSINWVTEFKTFYHNKLSSSTLTASAVNTICFFLILFYWFYGETESSSACDFVFHETKS